MISKSGSAVWQGALRDGTGVVSTQSGTLSNVDYSFAKRFEGVSGTNPEELLAAAHAACFSMALSNILGEHDLTATRIETEATVNLDPQSLSVASVQLDLTATIPGASHEAFQEAANAAKAGCPVSKLFDTDITLEARLTS